MNVESRKIAAVTAAKEAAEKIFLDQLHFAGAKAQHVLNDLRHE